MCAVKSNIKRSASRYGGIDIHTVTPLKTSGGRRAKHYLELVPAHKPAFSGQREISLERARRLRLFKRLGIPTPNKVLTFSNSEKSVVIVSDLSKGGRRFCSDAFLFDISSLRNTCNNAETVAAGVFRDMAILNKAGFFIGSWQRKILEPWVFFKKQLTGKKAYRALVDPDGLIEIHNPLPSTSASNVIRLMGAFKAYAEPRLLEQWLVTYFKYNPDEVVKQKVEEHFTELRLTNQRRQGVFVDFRLKF